MRISFACAHRDRYAETYRSLRIAGFRNFSMESAVSNEEFARDVFQSGEVDADVFAGGDVALFDREEGVVLLAMEEVMEPPRVAGFGDLIDAIRAEQFAELRVVAVENRYPVKRGDGMNIVSVHDNPP